MNRLFCFLLCLLCSFLVTAQTQRTRLVPNQSDWTISLSPQSDAWFASVVVVAYGGKGTAYDVKHAQTLAADPHVDLQDRQVFGPLYFDATDTQCQLRWNGSVLPDSVQIDVYYPKKESESQPLKANADDRACACPMPPHLTKEQWCNIQGACQPVNSPITTNVTHLIVHHSAGPNTASSWSAVVNSIWNYHVNTNGWSDIGYNWLIAPDGTLFQGRNDNIVGAHFCSQNSQTMGVCLLGTYTDVDITLAARNTLEQLLAWKSCDKNIDPDNINYHPGTQLILHTVSGHRDGCATECPGGTFHATIDQLRANIANLVAQCQFTSVQVEIAAQPKVWFHGQALEFLLPDQTGPAHIMVTNLLGQVLVSEQLTSERFTFSHTDWVGPIAYRIVCQKQEWSGVVIAGIE